MVSVYFWGAGGGEGLGEEESGVAKESFFLNQSSRRRTSKSNASNLFPLSSLSLSLPQTPQISHVVVQIGTAGDVRVLVADGVGQARRGARGRRRAPGEIRGGESSGVAGSRSGGLLAAALWRRHGVGDSSSKQLDVEWLSVCTRYEEREKRKREGATGNARPICLSRRRRRLCLCFSFLFFEKMRKNQKKTKREKTSKMAAASKRWSSGGSGKAAAVASSKPPPPHAAPAPSDASSSFSLAAKARSRTVTLLGLACSLVALAPIARVADRGVERAVAVSALVSLAGFFATRALIPVVAARTLRAGLFGMDINKKGTAGKKSFFLRNSKKKRNIIIIDRERPLQPLNLSLFFFLSLSLPPPFRNGRGPPQDPRGGGPGSGRRLPRLSGPVPAPARLRWGRAPGVLGRLLFPSAAASGDELLLRRQGQVLLFGALVGARHRRLARRLQRRLGCYRVHAAAGVC